MSVLFGNQLCSTATFLNAAGALTDPTTIVFRLRSPLDSEAVATYGTDSAVLRASVGVYTFDWTPSIPGRWVIRVEGRGGVHQSAEMDYKISASQVRGAQG